MYSRGANQIQNSTFLTDRMVAIYATSSNSHQNQIAFYALSLSSNSLCFQPAGTIIDNILAPLAKIKQIWWSFRHVFGLIHRNSVQLDLSESCSVFNRKLVKFDGRLVLFVDFNPIQPYGHHNALSVHSTNSSFRLGHRDASFTSS